jgi:hypothetical protein
MLASMARRRPPSARALLAGALACIVAVFGVLALRVRDGHDPALGSASASGSTGAAATQQPSDGGATSVDPYNYGDGGQAGSAQGWSSGPPTTRAS